MNRFDFLPNELILMIFDYLNPIDILYSFFNLNQQINEFLKIYFKSKIYRINLIKQLKSIELTDEQIILKNLQILFIQNQSFTFEE